MSGLLTLGQLLLALVFVVAGLAKFGDPPGTRRMLTAFGAPTALIPFLGLFLPLAELAVGVGLVIPRTARWGLMGSLLLLAVFSAVIAGALLRNKHPDCRCFGQLARAPISGRTLVRNAVLFGLALFLFFQKPSGTGAIVTAGLMNGWPAVEIAVITGGVVLAFQIWFSTHLLRQNGRILRRLEALEQRSATGGSSAAPAAGLPPGVSAPRFRLASARGGSVSLDELLAPGRTLLLLFSNPECIPCARLLPEIAAWENRGRDTLAPVLISRGSAEQHRELLEQYGLADVLLQSDWDVSEAYGVVGTPSAVLIRPDGTVGSFLANGTEAIRSLVARASGTERAGGAGGAPFRWAAPLLAADVDPVPGDASRSAAP